MRRKGGSHIRGVKEENNSRSVGHCMEFGFYAEIMILENFFFFRILNRRVTYAMTHLWKRLLWMFC